MKIDGSFRWVENLLEEKREWDGTRRGRDKNVGDENSLSDQSSS